MTTATDPEKTQRLSPDEAFSVLGDETRLQILQVLGETDGPLSFSDLFDRIDYEDSSNFGYHLDKLVGHFVTKVKDGYRLQQAGRRVVEAVLSGAVTENPVFEPTSIDEQCPLCGVAIEVGYHQERVEMYCTDCSGFFESAESEERYLKGDGFLGHMSLPPVGVDTRTPEEILDAAWTWKHLDVIADSSGICSRCSVPLDISVTVCDDHNSTAERCDHCGRQYATQFRLQCTNCKYDMHSIAPGCLLSHTELLAFLLEHGINPLAPESINDAMKVIANYDEEICSIDPFMARFTFTIGTEALTLTVNDDLTVVDTVRHSGSGPG